jgi:hypothetical protein
MRVEIDDGGARITSHASVSNQIDKRRAIMNKKIVSLVLVVVFALSTAGLGFAARVKCTVDAVDGDKVTMTCDKADKMKPGDKVKVSTSKKSAGIEGC